MKILFITANRLGDAVMSMGLLAALVDRYQDATFTIACGPFAADLFRAVPRLEKLLVVRKQPYNGHWFKLWRTLAPHSWDLVVDVRNSLVSRLLRSKKLATKKKDTGRHKVVDIGSILNLDPTPSPRLWLDEKAINNAARLLPEGVPLLALGPLANWAPKEWPLDRFASLANRLTATDGPLPHSKIVIIADSLERPKLLPLLSSIPPQQIIEVLGHDLLTVAACLKRCRFFVGNDSGLMHLASAVGTPTLGLFGPGDEKIYAPWGNKVATVRTPESIQELWSRVPYRGANHPNLMGGLTLKTVHEAALKFF